MKTRGAVTAPLAFMLFAASGQVRSLSNDRIREDIPYREAWNRQLAQNMEFVSNEASSIQYRVAGESQAWFEKSAQHFQEAPRISFRQLCFSFARDGKKAHFLAASAFRKVSGHPMDSDAGIANLADHFTLRSYYGDQTAEQVAKVFGSAFARSLFQLKPGSWQGPIESVSGWHLIWIDSTASGRAVSFSAPAVRLSTFDAR
jgi:peptidyl-prolyl cis-trans isomerase C